MTPGELRIPLHFFVSFNIAICSLDNVCTNFHELLSIFKVQGSLIYELCHEKTNLKVFVVVIPKKGWVRMAAPIILWVWQGLLENMIYEVKRLKF